MNKKIISIFVSMLLFVTVFSVTGAMNIEKTSSMTPKSASTGDPAWSDDFDSYVTGSALIGQGGWEGWNGNPIVTAYVVDDQARSTPNSCEVAKHGTIYTDTVHQFTNINTGDWILSTYLYVPSDMVGTSAFILMNYYPPEWMQNNAWSLQLEFSASTGKIWDSNSPIAELPLVLDDWAELRVEIDFNADRQTIYYNSMLLQIKSWRNGCAPGGAKNFAAINLYSGTEPTTSVYWDDFRLYRPEPLSCDADGPYEGLVTDEIQFNGTATGGKPPYQYLWDFGNGNTSTVKDPVYTYDEPGVYTVTLTVTDNAQNIATDETTATITGVPLIKIGDITGGLFKVNAVIKNAGFTDATGVDWSITLTGGIILSGKETSGRIASIYAGEEVTIKSDLILGIGKTMITVTAEIPESSDTKEQEAFILLFFIKI